MKVASPSLIQLGQQQRKLRLWVRSRLWAQVMAGMAMGTLVGTLLGPATGWLSPDVSRTLAAWLALPGHLFLSLIAIVLVPLVFASIVAGLTGAPSNDIMRSIGVRLAAFILVTTSAAAGIGVLLARYFQPGVGIGGEEAEIAPQPADAAVFDLAKLPEIATGVLPSNPAYSVVQGDLMAIVILALLTGIAASQVDRAKVTPFLALLDAVLSISMTVVKWAMMLAPIAVFGLMAQLMMQVGPGSLIGMLTYVATVLIGLGLLFVLYLLVLLVLSGVGPGVFLRRAGETLLLAFSTSSSSAVMPSTIQTARRLGVSQEVANLVVPLGATMNMAGTALYQGVAILFLAQMAGVELSLAQTLLIVATLVASSIGAPGTPGVSIAILISVAAGFGIPAGGMVILLGVDRLLDMTRTAVNVTGDLAAAVLLDRKAGAAC
ncbi:MAG: dicarboxylate/amino acid:cation symporter [Parasphingopyxis sp.]